MPQSTIETLMSELRTAKGPDRQLDARIAAAFGFRRVKTQLDSDNSRPRWIAPTGEEIGTIPFYTSSIDDAGLLLRWNTPGTNWGLSWEEGTASTQIATDEVCQAATPPLAVCLAAMQRLSKQPQPPRDSTEVVV